MKGTEKQVKYATDLINDRIKWNRQEATNYSAMQIETENGTLVSFLDVERYLESLLADENTNCGNAIAYFKATKYDVLANEVAEVIVANEIELATKEEVFAWGSEIIREQGKGFPKEETEAEVEELRKELGLETQVEVVETLSFPTIQSFLENARSIEEYENGNLVVRPQGRVFLTDDKEFCKKYLASKMFGDSDKTTAKQVVKINIADKSYDFVELVIGSEPEPEPEQKKYLHTWNCNNCGCTFYSKGYHMVAEDVTCPGCGTWEDCYCEEFDHETETYSYIEEL